MTANRVKITAVLVFLPLFFVFLPSFSPARALPAEMEGTGIACNPRQGVWNLYQPAMGKPYLCGGERLVYWSEIEPEEGQFNWAPLEWYLQNTQGEIFLGIPVTAGEPGRPCADDPVLTGNACKGGQSRGQYRPANGRTCNGGCLPNWLEPKMCAEIGLPENCWDSSDQGSRKQIIIGESPIIWNKTYRYYFEDALAHIGQWLDAHPDYKKRIGLIYASSGGGWGEMNLVSGQKWRNQAWLEAGYTNKLFAAEVYRTIEKYNQAFPDLPVSVQTGSGMFCYSGPTADYPDGNPAGCDHADEPGRGPSYYLFHGWPAFSANGSSYPAQTEGIVSKYGLKMNLRLNGWGSVKTNGVHPHGRGADPYCDFSACADPADPACSLATCSFESGRGPENWDWLGSCSEDEYFRPIAGSLDSSVSIQSVKWNEAVGSVAIPRLGGCVLTTANALAYEARHIGAQILLRQPSLTVENGQLVFRGLFYNRGNRPLFSVRAEGKKWVADSFRLEFGFYQEGEVKGTVRVDPDRPSYFWSRETNDQNWAQGRFLAPGGLAAGEYRVKLSLVDPKTDYRWNFFDSQGDESMRAVDLGLVTVGPGGASLQPTQVPTSVPSGSGCVCSDPIGKIARQRGDFDCSGTVDIGDFSLWVVKYVRSELGGESLSCAASASSTDDFNVWREGHI